MIKRFREVVQSHRAPEDKNVLWLDISNSEEPILKYYINGSWVAISGSGVTPTPSHLKNTYYYGASDTVINLDEIATQITGLHSTKNASVSDVFNKIFFYIIIHSTQSILSVITVNNENITSQFINKGACTISGQTYNLYEFYLDTLIPLDVTATIKITE